MFKSLFLLIAFLAADGCSTNQQKVSDAHSKRSVKSTMITDQSSAKQVAYFASGCFWCVEEIFESLQGVEEVVSGYSGGTKEDANYTDVSAGRTKHAEAVQVFYDEKIISYEQLVQVFFGSHDPTTLNRQGPDRGYQYRSAIFYQNDTEKKIAENVIRQLSESKVFNGQITTTLDAYEAFYPAEDYHQDYVRNNPTNGYVKSVSLPRFKKFTSKFPTLLKSNH